MAKIKGVSKEEFEQFFDKAREERKWANMPRAKIPCGLHGHEFETRCAICLRGRCVGTRVLQGKTGMWGIFVGPCPECAKGYAIGLTDDDMRRWSDRQLDAVENGAYSGQGWWDESGST